jgi:galactokinase
VIVTRAPGRLDVMGGIADYSGSLVLQLPLAEACHVAVQRHPLPKQRLWRHMTARQVRRRPRASAGRGAFHADAVHRSGFFHCFARHRRACCEQSFIRAGAA